MKRYWKSLSVRWWNNCDITTFVSASLRLCKLSRLYYLYIILKRINVNERRLHLTFSLQFKYYWYFILNNYLFITAIYAFIYAIMLISVNVSVSDFKYLIITCNFLDVNERDFTLNKRWKFSVKFKTNFPW